MSGMHVIINGETQDYESDVSVAMLIERLGFSGRRIAVEINGDIIPRSLHARRCLQEGDRIEIVQAIGGG